TRVAAARQSALNHFPVFSPFAWSACLAVQIPLAIGDQRLAILYGPQICILQFSICNAWFSTHPIAPIRPITPLKFGITDD
ncbi:MAG: hypothetical protein WCO56_08825, partial [Verrucomicrobiota bacterium]